MNGAPAKKERNGFGFRFSVFVFSQGHKASAAKERSDFKTHLQILDCGETGSALTRVHNTVRRI